MRYLQLHPRLRILPLVALLAAACAQGGGGGAARGASPEADSPFPAPEELEALRRSPPAEAPLGEGPADVARWELEGPLRDAVDVTPRAGGSPFDAELERAARSRPGLVLATEEMHCVAREVGLFLLRHERQPPPAAQRFLAARCGLPAGGFDFMELHALVPEESSEAQLFEAWREQLLVMLRTQLVGGPRFAGVWVGRDEEERGVLVVASAERSVHLEPVPTLRPPGGRVLLRGEALVPAEEVGALVNRGAFGVAPCRANREVVLPRFELACDLDPDDATTWITLSLRPPGRVLGRHAADVLMRAPGVRADVWTPPVAPRSRRTAAEDAPWEEAATELVNVVRRRAGFEPLELSATQSRVASELAPHFFAAVLGRADETVADMVMLGMLAGWEVEGLVQRGRAAADWAPERDVGRLVAEALVHPDGRATLLAEEARVIALGAVAPGDGAAGGGFGALYATYELFSEEAHARSEARVRSLLDTRRAERGRRPSGRVPALEPVLLAAASQIQGGAAARDVLDPLLEESAAALGGSVQGYVGEVNSLDDIEFPEEFLAEPGLRVGIGVAVQRPEGEPWGRYVVLVVAARPTQMGT